MCSSKGNIAVNDTDIIRNVLIQLYQTAFKSWQNSPSVKPLPLYVFGSSSGAKFAGFFAYWLSTSSDKIYLKNIIEVNGLILEASYIFKSKENDILPIRFPRVAHLNQANSLRSPLHFHRPTFTWYYDRAKWDNYDMTALALFNYSMKEFICLPRPLSLQFFATFKHNVWDETSARKWISILQNANLTTKDNILIEDPRVNLTRRSLNTFTRKKII